VVSALTEIPSGGGFWLACSWSIQVSWFCETGGSRFRNAQIRRIREPQVSQGRETLIQRTHPEKTSELAHCSPRAVISLSGLSRERIQGSQGRFAELRKRAEMKRSLSTANGRRDDENYSLKIHCTRGQRPAVDAH